MADHLAVLERALGAVSAQDVDAYQACLHDDCIFELPYAGPGAATTKSELLKLLGFLLATFETFDFVIDRVYELIEPDMLIVEYSSRATARVGDVVYANRYVGIFEFRDGLISRWVEYANPVAFNDAMAAIRRAQQAPTA